MDLDLARNTRREFNEHVIEEGNAALDGRGHTHVVLLHELLDEVGLDIGIEEALQHLAR